MNAQSGRFFLFVLDLMTQWHEYCMTYSHYCPAKEGLSRYGHIGLFPSLSCFRSAA